MKIFIVLCCSLLLASSAFAKTRSPTGGNHTRSNIRHNSSGSKAGAAHAVVARKVSTDSFRKVMNRKVARK